MKAIILVGGFGTRLRPLTADYPKSVVPFAGRPMVEWQIEALVNYGVKEIVLAIFYKECVLAEFVSRMIAKYKVSIICSVEHTPLNTGGPIKLAEKYLFNSSCQTTQKSRENCFFVLNSDIICDYPLEQLYQKHLSHNGLITITGYPVEDPSRYGVIVTETEELRVKEFVEKPKEFVGNLINAGIYLFSQEVLSLMQEGAFSLERDTFPFFANRKEMFVFELKGFWKDIGIPSDFLSCSIIYLNHFQTIGRIEVDDFKLVVDQEGFPGVNLIHRNAKIESGASVGPYAVVHSGVVVRKGAYVARTILMDNCDIGEYSHVLDSVLMFGVKVGKGTRIEGNSLLGEGVVVENEKLLCGQKLEKGN